ncbi:FGGY-family carbohydrate kinase [Streptococcus castoreus]|uniref:FGGY-family carbohydrate kinase n=1 Tax=Streptococcus castoreus TaxID=254786 RepID=UPI000429F7ED
MSGQEISDAELYPLLFNAALAGEKGCGGLLSYGYYSGESITGLTEGRPILVRTPESRFTVPNLMRSHILSAFTTLAIGIEILVDKEAVGIDKLLGHGGIFNVVHGSDSRDSAKREISLWFGKSESVSTVVLSDDNR